MYTLLIWSVTIILGANCQNSLFHYDHLTDNMNSSNQYEEAVQRSPLMRDRAHGYLQVRPGVHLFYQLFYANGTKVGASSQPLIIWIQGGPGIAASGVGSFGEIGPLDMNFEPRNHTWVKKGNMLLIDHPVGAGFSYADNDSLYVETDHRMATDLQIAIKMFLRKYTVFRKAPTYIIGQSYGGKICPRLAMYLYKDIKTKHLKMNFKGIGVGGGWVSPRESILMQPEIMFQSGTIDPKTYLEAKRFSLKMAKALEKRNYEEAAKRQSDWLKALNFEHINYYNYMKPSVDLQRLEYILNYYVKPTLNVNQSIEWHEISQKAYFSLGENIFTPSTIFLERLLKYSDLRIVVYNGNLDVVTPVAGASNWVHKLRWYGAGNFSKASFNPITEEKNGYYKVWDKLSFWSVLGAGHWVPEDNPEAMDHILNYLTSED